MKLHVRKTMLARKAYTSTIELECTCVGIGIPKWNSLMEGAVKADGSKIRRMIKEQLPELYKNLALNYHNPYESSCVRTNTHLIYVHSGIEYFLKIIKGDVIRKVKGN